MTVRAVFERGVFRPATAVSLPEGSVVDLQWEGDAVDVRALAPAGTDESLLGLYEILGRRYDSGNADTAARHDLE